MDIVVGSPIAGRVHRDVEPLIGFFVNTLVLRSDLSGNPRFVELLAAGKQTILDAYAHQHVPFEMLVEGLRPERTLSHSPLFQILFVLQNLDRGEAALSGLRLEGVGESSGVVRLDLELNVVEVKGGLALHWLYKKDLFSAGTIERMASSFGVLLAGILERLETRVESLPLLTQMDRSQLLAWNETEVSYPENLCLHELIEAQARRTPQGTAVVSAGAGGSLTFRELCGSADRLAQRLRGAGVGAESVVGVLAERSLEMVVGL